MNKVVDFKEYREKVLQARKREKQFAAILLLLVTSSVGIVLTMIIVMASKERGFNVQETRNH